MFDTNSSSNCQLRFKLSFELVVLVLYVTAASYTVVRCFVDRSNYIVGYRAYQNANCAVAVDRFDKIINGWRVADLYNYAALAQQKKSECVRITSAKETPRVEFKQ